MPANTDPALEARRRRYRKQAVQGVVFFGLLQLACVVCFAALCFIPGLPLWCLILFGALAALCGGMMIPALIVLKRRFQEIEGGELDAAAEY